MEVDDATLLRCFAENASEQAFAAFVTRHSDVLYSSALRRTGQNAALAQEIVQDVFILADRNAHKLVHHPVVSAWLYTAIRNAASNRLRAESRRLVREYAAMINESGNSDDPGWDAVRPAIDSALDALKEQDRRALILRFFDHRPFGEIATVLKIGEDAARMRVERSLAKLRIQLQKKGITSTGAALAGFFVHHAVQAAPAGLAAQVAQVVFHSTVRLPRSGLFGHWARRQLAYTTASIAVIVASALSIVRDFVSFPRDPTGAGTTAQAEPLQRFSPEDGFTGPGSIETSSSRTVQGIAGNGHFAAGGRRALLSAAYSHLYGQLGFNSDEIRRFESMHLPSLESALWLYEKPAARSMVQTSEWAAAPDREYILQQDLGPERYSVYREFRRTFAMREIAIYLAAAVYLDDPITAETGSQLAQILARFSSAFIDGRDASIRDLDWTNALVAADPLLNPKQRAALRSIRSRLELESALLTQLETATEPSK